MNKRKPKEEKPKANPYGTFNAEHPEFVGWWKKHRHSGFVEDDQGKWHWNTLPAEAWYIDKYRVEFSIDSRSPYQSKHEYSATEIEGWAKEQKKMEDYAQGDYGCVPRADFEAALARAVSVLRRKMNERTRQAKHETNAK
jgi:hypothetical protein